MKKKKHKSRSLERWRPLEAIAFNYFTFKSSRLNLSYYGNMNIPGTHGTDEDEQEENVYANADASDDVRKEMENSDTKRHQTSQHTGTETHFIITITNTHFSHVSN